MAKGFRRHKHVKIMHEAKKKAAKKKARKKMPLANKGLTYTKGGAITRVELRNLLKRKHELLPHGYEIRKKKR